MYMPSLEDTAYNAQGNIVQGQNNGTAELLAQLLQMDFNGNLYVPLSYSQKSQP